MRDFEQEVINAAGPLPPIRTEEFSWSLARHYLFRFCRRAYFIRYYLAQGGWDAYSHTLAREALVAGWQTRLSTPPRLSAKAISFRDATNFR